MKRAFVWTLCVLLFASILSADAYGIQRIDPTPSKGVVHLSRLVEKLGTGTDALVAVRLRDKSVVSGYVADAGPASFTVMDRDSGQPRTVAYEQVTRFAGYNLVTSVTVQHGTGVRGKLARAITYIIPGQRVPANHLNGESKLLIIGIAIGILIAIVLAKTL